MKPPTVFMSVDTQAAILV